jgi:hypothetical protein
MEQRRPRLGDIVDDYCPRERRITNHAVVAMIEDAVKQTRCTTCDADHEYKQARVPPPRRRKETPASPTPTDMADHEQHESIEETAFAEAPLETAPAEEEGEIADTPEAEDDSSDQREDEGPVHRRLIRATLPRPERQPPDRKEPEFTMRQPGGHGNQRHGRGRRPTRGPQGSFSGPMRFGSGSHQNPAQSRQRQNGNRPGPSGNQRGGRPQGQQRGPGRKRGR